VIRHPHGAAADGGVVGLLAERHAFDRVRRRVHAQHLARLGRDDPERTFAERDPRGLGAEGDVRDDGVARRVDERERVARRRVRGADRCEQSDGEHEHGAAAHGPRLPRA